MYRRDRNERERKKGRTTMTTKEEGRKKRRVGSESGGGRGGEIRGEGRRREKSTPRRAHCIPRIVRRCNPL